MYSVCMYIYVFAIRIMSISQSVQLTCDVKLKFSSVQFISVCGAALLAVHLYGNDCCSVGNYCACNTFFYKNFRFLFFYFYFFYLPPLAATVAYDCYYVLYFLLAIIFLLFFLLLLFAAFIAPFMA